MSIKDLHICKDSMTSKSQSESCICGPEYFCGNVYPEGGYSVSTYVSWQHFPRSTSSRSYCDDSDDFTRMTSETTTLMPIEEEKESMKPSTLTQYPITKSFSQLNALHYLEIRHVFEFLNFLLSHLVCNEPEDPVEFLIGLLNKCLKYRDSFGEPPLLLTHAHIESLYNAFDPFERGYLTIDQYKEAMRSLGLEKSITPYKEESVVNEDCSVEKSTFIFEAERCLTENLKNMLRIPKIWEENRAIWIKKMTKKKPINPDKPVKKENCFGEKTDKAKEVVKKENSCNCPFAANMFCHCTKVQEMKNEPEQLFLN